MNKRGTYWMQSITTATYNPYISNDKEKGDNIMVWALVWMQLLVTSQSVKYFHVDTFDSKEECVAAMSNAAVLVSNKSETLACLELQVE